MAFQIIILYSLLLVSARGSRPSARDLAVRDEWPESSLAGPNDERIDALKERHEKSLITLSDLEEEHEKGRKASSVSDVIFAGRTISTVAATGRGRRRWMKRAAEILAGTSVKHQVASVSSPSVPAPETTMSTPMAASNTTHVPDSTSAETSSEPTTLLSSSTTVATTSIETMASVTRMDVVSSTSIVPESQDESVQSNQTINTVVITQSSTTQFSPAIHENADEYFADDASSSPSATDANFDDEETTVMMDKITGAPSSVQHPEADSGHANTSPLWADELNPTSVPDTSPRPFLAVSSVVAIGRALSQEESVPWPEAKSTKVIGTIIEDIHGPFSDGVSSVSTISPDVLTGSGIVAIAMCIFLVLVTTAGASGYWWYRRRYLLNRPETLSERYAPSETGLGAGDDIFRVGYVHSPELPRDSSEEMYSLDNDSFLTSLEAMTIPTYWTETIKHTKL
ncbi:uncharacterized protein LOC130686748 isoform X2 [Daphnia carinata]|uniref:uncharacterized protein LOC130686748 isoform X2 n=1 Tax=Daphnia carinata TaxID=120202 RepID=UPI0025803AB8|nr:uncharacterized protein LOC130686748 isoform X2 [Daphnia carinata]